MFLAATAALVILSANPAPPSAVALVTEHDAPWDARTSFLSSAAATGVGFTLMFASTLRLVATSQTQLASNMAMYGTGFLLMNFGPNFADAFMGDPMRLVTHGLLRLGVLLGGTLMVLAGPIGILGAALGMIVWMGWVAADTLDSYRAPQRWAQRQNQRDAAPSRVTPLTVISF